GEGTSFDSLPTEEVTVSPLAGPESSPAARKSRSQNDADKNKSDSGEQESSIASEEDKASGATGVNGDGQTTPCNARACEGGEPINLKTGEERLTLVDAVLDGPLPLTVARTYRSSNHTDSGLGVGWSHTLAEKLVVRKSRDVVELHDAEGRVIS